MNNGESKANNTEADDFVPTDLEAGPPKVQTNAPRLKMSSDITGLLEATRKGKRGANRRTVSDMVLFMSLDGEGGGKSGRRRQTSDMVTKFGYLPSLGYADLQLAERVQARGTQRERQASGMSNEEFTKEIEEEEEALDEFELNFKGLTTAEAEERLLKYGRNELPEKNDPKWLIFLRQFWAPMPIMIWIAIIIELGIQNYIDMGILLFIQFANGSISFYET